MTITKRQGVLDGLDTAFESIPGINTVERVASLEGEVPDSDCPHIGFSPDESAPLDQGIMGNVVTRLPILVTGHMVSTDLTDKTKQIADLEQAVLDAVFADATLGGYAITTIWTGTITTECLKSEALRGEFVLKLTIEYNQSLGA